MFDRADGSLVRVGARIRAGAQPGVRAGHTSQAIQVLAEAAGAAEDGTRARLDTERGVLAAIRGDVSEAAASGRATLANPVAPPDTRVAASVSLALALAMTGDCDGVARFLDDAYAAADAQRTHLPLPTEQIGVMHLCALCAGGRIAEAVELAAAGDADGGSYLSQPAISGDGRFVAFTSRVAFDPADTGSGGEIYLVDRERTAGPPGATCTTDFTDVSETDVHAANICRLVELEVTVGTTPTTYGPAQSVSRAEMASFLARAAELEGVEGTGFTDVDPDNVHTPNIYAVRDAGITTGVTPTTFEPDGNVRRDQMASFLVRMIDVIDAA